MTTFLVHIAGDPDPDGVQRCAVCGAVLLDGRAQVVDCGMAALSWWVIGGLVATDKDRDGRRGGVIYAVLPERRPLGGDELACTATP